MLRLLHECGMPHNDVDFINCDGVIMNKLLLKVIIYFVFHMEAAACLLIITDT